MKSSLTAIILLLTISLFQQSLNAPLTQKLLKDEHAFEPTRYQMNFEAHLLLNQLAPLRTIKSTSELELIKGISGKSAKKLHKKVLEIKKTLTLRAPQSEREMKNYIKSELEEIERIGPKKAKYLMKLFTLD